MGGFGAPDRGGSREGKKSLRGNKQALQKLVKDEQKGHVKAAPRPSLSEKPPPALPPAEGGRALVDAAAQLASRQFDRDQFKVLQRAASSGVGPIVTYTTDDSKLEALVRTAKENAGQVYCMVGVHSDNIKRASDRLTPARLEQLKDMALEPGCVAVLAGLAFRDVGTRYAQERALSEQMGLAAAVGLPLVLYEVRASEALLEQIREFRSSGAGEGRAATTSIAIFNFSGSAEELSSYLQLGCYIVLTGRVCDSTDRGQRLREMAAAIQPGRLMLASDSPFTTPQNIPDVFVREGRNEPSNLPYVVEALSPAMGLSAEELAATTRRTTLAFFGIQEAAEAAEEAAAAASAAAAADTATAAEAYAGCAASAGGKHGKQPVTVVATAQSPAAGPATPQDRRRKGRANGKVAAAATDGHRKGSGRKAQQAAHETEDGDGDGQHEQVEDESQEGSGSGGEGAGARGGAGAAGLFALMQLREEDDDEQEEEEEGERGEGVGGAQGSGDAVGAAGTAAERAASCAAASTSQPGATASRPGGQAKARLPPPRNFVAEHAAAAASKGPATGPRVSYSCRGCRMVLFTEADAEPHTDEERALFAASKHRKKARGRATHDSEVSLCSVHFLRKPLAWMEACLQSEGPRLGEGKLVCPTCAAKLGKWAAGPGAAAGVQCSCGVLVPPPAYAVLRARLDVLDSQLDIASAVQSALKAYEEEAASGGSSSGSDDAAAAGGRKKRQKQKRNKTANFSSFRNKNFGFSVKQQRQLAESVTAAATDADGGGGDGGALSTMREESD